jgi:hypothetical protein
LQIKRVKQNDGRYTDKEVKIEKFAEHKGGGEWIGIVFSLPVVLLKPVNRKPGQDKTTEYNDANGDFIND